MNLPLRRPWTQEQFFSWAEAQEARYEFDGVQPVATTGGNAAHALVMRNVSFALRLRLLRQPCQSRCANTRP